MYNRDEAWLLYLMRVSIEDDRVDNTRCVSAGVVNPLGVEDSSLGKVKRAVEGEPEDGAPVNCEDKQVNCAQFFCYIDRLERGDSVRFRFMARLWESTLFNVGNINITSYVSIISVDQQDFVFGPEGKSAMKSQFYPSSATKRNYLWIIIGSVIAGILLLILLIIILWKCGFFKRKAPPAHRPEAHNDEGEG